MQIHVAAPTRSDAPVDVSGDPIVLINTIVANARQDEDLASCLLELGVSACLKLGLDARALVGKTQDDILLFEEIFCASDESEDLAAR